MILVSCSVVRGGRRGPVNLLLPQLGSNEAGELAPPVTPEFSGENDFQVGHSQLKRFAQANEVIRMHRLAHPNNSGRHRDSIRNFPLQQHRIASCSSSPSPRPKTPLIAWFRTNSTGLFTNSFLLYSIWKRHLPRGVWHPAATTFGMGTDVRRFQSEHLLPITCKTLCK